MIKSYPIKMVTTPPSVSVENVISGTVLRKNQLCSIMYKHLCNPGLVTNLPEAVS